MRAPSAAGLALLALVSAGASSAAPPRARAPKTAQRAAAPQPAPVAPEPQAPAASPPAPSTAALTLAAYTDLALKAAPELAQAQALYEAAQARWKAETASAWLPTLSLTGLAYPYGQNPADGYRFVHWRLNRNDMSFNTAATLNLFNSFQDAQRVRSARYAREAAGQGLEASRRERALAAAKAYLDLALKDRLLEVAAENLRAQEEQYRLTQDLYKHGMKSLSDLLKSETDWRSSELRMASARAERQRALAGFDILVAREPDAPAELAPVPDPPEGRLPPLAADLESAERRRPEALRAEALLGQAGVTARQARRNLLPSFAVDATWSRQDVANFGSPVTTLTGIPNPNYQLALKLSLPSGYNVATQAHQWSAAAAERRRAAEELAAVRRQARLEAVEARIGLERAFTAARVAAQKEDLSRRNLDLVTEQYRQGSADVIRLGQAQLDYLNSRVERSQAAHDAALGRLQYRLSIGETIWE